MTRIALAVCLALGLAGCADRAGTQASADRNYPQPTDADNTVVNMRERHDTVKTPLDQNENTMDIHITADIRSRVVDSDLSINAKNVKIITQDGRVTLRGPVKSEQERSQIVGIATGIAGTGNVENQLEVETSP